MKTLFFCALFGTTLLCAEPTLETQLIVACKSGVIKSVEKVLTQGATANQTALLTALDRGYTSIANILVEYNKDLSIEKKWFRSYCAPTELKLYPQRLKSAFWVLDHGNGPWY